MRLGHLGPAGTFSEEAAAGPAREAGAELVALPTVRAVVAAVLAGDVDRALVPIENSLEGTVNQTVDALSAEEGLAMVGEAVLAIQQCLIARAEVTLSEIDRVLSHPQGHAQCARFLAEELPRARLVPTSSTAEAVRALEGEPPGTAAIGARAAAIAHGATVLREDVSDEPGNATRFAWLGPAGAEPFPPAREGAPWKTSVLFAGSGDARPGWLVRCLSELASRDVNLVRIESRPARSALGHYVFLADCEGRATDERVAAAVAALGRHCDRVRVLGTYPTASEPEGPRIH